MAEKNGWERSLTLWNDQISGDRPALRTSVGYIVKSSSIELFNYFVVEIERRLCVIIEKVQCALIVGCGRGSVLDSRHKRFGHNFCHLSDGRLSVFRRSGRSYEINGQQDRCAIWRTQDGNIIRRSV